MDGEVVDNVTPAPADNVTPTDWKAGFSETERAALDKFTTVEALGKSYLNAETLIGRDKIPMPKTPEEWQQAYNRLGRPETADKYDLKINDEIMPKVKDLGVEDQQWFKELAHKAGLNTEQANTIFGEYWNKVAAENEGLTAAMERERTEAEATLKKEWLGGYDAELAIANKALAHVSREVFGDDTFIKHLEERGLSNDPVLAKVLNYIGKNSLEESNLVGSGSTVRDVDRQIAEIQSNPAYADKRHPSHAALVQTMQSLFAAKYPEER